MRKQIGIFGTRNDLVGLFKPIEEEKQLQYVRFGHHDVPDIVPESYTILSLPKLGVSDFGEPSEQMYIILPSGADIHAVVVPQHRGGTIYNISMIGNDRGICFQVGGNYKDSAFISGEISTISPHPDSIALFDIVKKEVRKNFTRIKTFWLGPEALVLFRNGMRFTQGVRGSMTLVEN
jgi:hypothetical protein